jgi:alkylation response protein AidB-like acyl-CoA dehydrogenase
MEIRSYISKLLLDNFIKNKQTFKRAGKESSIAKLYISEAIMQNSIDAIMIHGAYGYTEEAGLFSNLSDSIGYKFASGTSDVQKNIIAKWLNLDA